MVKHLARRMVVSANVVGIQLLEIGKYVWALQVFALITVCCHALNPGVKKRI